MENNASSRPINCQLYLLTKINSSSQNLLQFLIINLLKCLFIWLLIHLCHFCYGLMFSLLIHCKLENLFSVNFLVRKLKSITSHLRHSPVYILIPLNLNLNAIQSVLFSRRLKDFSVFTSQVRLRFHRSKHTEESCALIVAIDSFWIKGRGTADHGGYAIILCKYSRGENTTWIRVKSWS